MQSGTTTTVTKSADLKPAKRLLKGDRALFDVFFQTYYPRPYRAALARLDAGVFQLERGINTPL